MRAIRSAAFIALALLTGCGSDSGDKPKTPSSSGTPITFDVPTGKIALAPVTVELEPHRGIGTEYKNVDCWVRMRSVMPEDFPAPDMVTSALARSLAAARLSVSGAPSADVASAGAVDYLIVASVPSAHADSCVNSFFNDTAADVDAQVAVSWHLWSVRDKRIVYETTTTGTATAPDPTQRITAGVIAALGDATRQFLQATATQQYLTYGHVLSPTPVAGVAAPVPTGGAAPIPTPPSGFKVARPSLGPILVPVKAARAGGTVDAAAAKRVTLALAPGGAAFALGDGYLLTSQAALGSTLTAGVELAPGQVAEAKVVRSDADVGVALLKIDGALPSSLPVQPRRNAVGDKVFGVGPGGLVTGSFTATRAAGGRDLVALDGALPGGPVMDPSGNVIGILLPDGGFASMGTVFRALELGAQLGDE